MKFKRLFLVICYLFSLWGSCFVVRADGLSQPNGLHTVVVSPDSASIAWSPVAGASSYEIYQNGSSLGSTVDNSYVVSGVSGSNVSIWVTAVSSSVYGVVESSPSSAVSIQFPLPPPSAIQGLTVQTVGNSSLLSWVNSPAAEQVTNYHVYVNGQYLGSSFTNQYKMPVAIGETYSVFVRGVNSFGEGTPSQTLQFVATILDSPANVMVSDRGFGTLYLAWNPVSGASSYTIYQGSSIVADRVYGTTTSIPLSTGGDYLIGVQAVNGSQVSGITQMPVHVTDQTNYSSIGSFVSYVFSITGQFAPILETLVGTVGALLIALFAIRFFKGLA